MFKKVFIISTVLLLSSFQIYSAHTTLLLSSQLLGGGYNFNQESTSFGGKFNLNLVPAVKFGNHLLIPVYSFEYNGIKDVKELVGGGTLIQQYITNMFYLKSVFKISLFKIKPKLGVTSQIIKETQDEEWTKGLFDYYKTNFSLETEFCINENTKLFLTPSVYSINFYNYKTLATEKYGKELSSVGKDILNFDATEISFDFKVNKYISLNTYFVQKSFKDQYLVTITGEYSSEKRKDSYGMFGVNLIYPIKPLGATSIFSSLGLQYSLNISNQSHYDVERTKFIKDYYNYNEISLLPQLIFAFNTVPMNLQLNYNIYFRQYSNRPIQDKEGNYLDDKTTSLTQYFSMILSFPLMEKFNGFIQQNYVISNSNMEYKQVYRYNYNAYNVMVGLSFEY